MKVVPNINELRNDTKTFASKKKIQMIIKTRASETKMFETINFGRTHINKRKKIKKQRYKNIETHKINKEIKK